MGKRELWITSDTHYYHANIIRYSKRPWLRDGDEILNEESGRMEWISHAITNARALEMTEEMIAWHNELVKPGHEVWHLGDFCLARDDHRSRVEKLVGRLNGQYNWIFGNHDHRAARKADGFNIKGYYHELRGIGPEKAMLVLSHYAMRVWNKKHHGAIQLYGHSHGSLPEDPNSLSYDVGVDCHNYRPIHIDEVLAYMKKKRAAIEKTGKSWKSEDHQL